MKEYKLDKEVDRIEAGRARSMKSYSCRGYEARATPETLKLARKIAKERFGPAYDVFMKRIRELSSKRKVEYSTE
jgi:hypothetical protein